MLVHAYCLKASRATAWTRVFNLRRLLLLRERQRVHRELRFRCWLEQILHVACLLFLGHYRTSPFEFSCRASLKHEIACRDTTYKVFRRNVLRLTRGSDSRAAHLLDCYKL